MIVQACGGREIIEARVARAKGGGRKVRQRPRVSQPPLRAVENQRLALGGAVAALAVVAELERAAAFGGDEIDDSADRRRAVERTPRAAHDLDAVKIVAGQAGKVEGASRAAVGVDAVDQDQRLGRTRAANRDVGLVARRPALVDLDAGDLAQHIAGGVNLLLLGLRRADDAYGGANRIERL